MKIWLITDTHFGHKAMQEYCGRPEGVEDLIFKNLKVVSDHDIVIHLGDVCIGNDAEWNDAFNRNVNGKHWLLRGNHDGKSNSWYMGNGWDFVGEQIKDKYFGKKICLSHYPQYWDGWYDLNIHGHFHNSDHRRYEDEMKFRKNGYQKLLAIEYTDYKPVLLESLL